MLAGPRCKWRGAIHSSEGVPGMHEKGRDLRGGPRSG